MEDRFKRMVETRRKNGSYKANSGSFKKGENKFLGKHHSQETKLKISIANK